MAYTILTMTLFIAEVLFIRAARHWNLIDRPNERSLHTNITTVRGGGIIFWLAAAGVFSYTGFALPWFFAGLTLVAAVSFWDDIQPVPKRYRLVGQCVGWALALVQFGIFPSQWILLTILMLTGVGLLNTYNFMDGINGMTAFYSLVTVGTLWYGFVNLPNLTGMSLPVTIEFSSLFPAVCIALLVFTYFNARKKAICFAGDVGSVTMGFIVGYGLLGLIWSTQSFLPLLLLTVYGIDTSLTIGQRLWQKQNIFRPHRQHLFQVLVGEGKWSHIQVAGLYAAIQLVINSLVMRALFWPARHQWVIASVVLGVTAFIYCVVKWRFLNPERPEPSRSQRDDKAQAVQGLNTKCSTRL